MSETRIEILLHDDLHRAANALAARRDISVGQLVRDLLAREITCARNAKPPVRADERLLAPLRARLADDLAHARDWSDLERRLNAKGYALRAASARRPNWASAMPASCAASARPSPATAIPGWPSACSPPPLGTRTAR